MLQYTNINMWVYYYIPTLNSTQKWREKNESQRYTHQKWRKKPLKPMKDSRSWDHVFPISIISVSGLPIIVPLEKGLVRLVLVVGVSVVPTSPWAPNPQPTVFFGDSLHLGMPGDACLEDHPRTCKRLVIKPH